MLLLVAALCLQGQDAFADYARAAEVVHGGVLDPYLEHGVEMPPSDEEPQQPDALRARLAKMSTLAARREAVQRFGKALEWVRVGNGKPLDATPAPVSLDDYPHLYDFKSIAKLAQLDAYVKRADGDTRGATDTLLQTLTFGSRFAGRSMIAHLVANAVHAIALSGFAERQDTLTEHDALAVIDHVRRDLASPTLFVEVVRADRDRSRREMVHGVEDLDKTGVEFNQGTLWNYLSLLPAADRSRVGKLASRAFEEQYDEVVLLLSGPESGWGPPAGTASAESEAPPASIEEAAVQLARTFTWGLHLFGESAAKNRTQLRLLRLIGRVVAFKWAHGRLPSSLEDAAPPDEIEDPLSGGRFLYTPKGDTFRVYSKGTKALGEIDLRYMRGRNESQPPPPLAHSTHGTLATHGSQGEQR